jgi:hypothetical protein
VGAEYDRGVLGGDGLAHDYLLGVGCESVPIVGEGGCSTATKR